MRARAAFSDDALREQPGGLSVRERTRRRSDLVRTKIADLLGYRDRAELDLTRSFREIGFDSVQAVELTAATDAERIQFISDQFGIT
ncbi:acyl carrier protein [Amycolatopsis dendrobii]|uniref:Acyl carrier protein n=1 Tax=Amycolatopsis dendrobii TaxID=2760662 RepID=A0A7W3Z8L6_9PSEU|nr:acyl carrier protein [Amycolatopsis dendrobii]MBB1152516.1 acyl carrier protein [Amycolatopsis dendrobii]